MTRRPSLSSYILAEATPAEIARQWTKVEARLRRRHDRRVIALSISFACAAAIVLVCFLLRSEHPGRVFTSRNEPMLFSLEDGSQLLLASGSDVKLLRQRKNDVHLELVRGGSRFDVRHHPGQRFRVTAADVDVVVTGTAFVVELEGEEQTARVRVERGTVEVRSREEERVLAYLRAGESWPPGAGESWPPGAGVQNPPPSPPAGEPPSPPAGEPPSPSRGEPTEATALARVAPPSPPAESRHESPVAQLLPTRALPSAAPEHRPAGSDSDPRQLFEEANAARRSGEIAKAASLLDTLLLRYPRDPRAALASFELGRLRLDALGDLPGAVQALRQSIALAPAGVFREDAEACLATAHARMRDRPRCEHARRSYLEHYPRGTHAGEMSALTCPDR